DDFAFRIGVARLPFTQLNDDFVADVRLSTYVARFWHVNIVRHARVIRDDVGKLLAALESPNDAAAFAFQNANDASGILTVGLRTQTLWPDIAPDQDAILMQRGRSGVFWDGDLFERGIIRLQKTSTTARDSNSAWNQIGIARAD